ncbi:molybdate ABC transporter substrate-binding protein [Microlunatus panaciterrae]|uniref:Molybdate transport system substrate-binding protein n=1 Tax=Microlunatus panaciterrae TaxID=400768 RepID=A0ABS2RLR5_9ACTN|nr:molybdate ABC transporter substrate-binding protein [Microlunatus panaciterrae]MBM7799527.1 molybdate transport system substrate-binding protein [Microlunatus panaciterrae]
MRLPGRLAALLASALLAGCATGAQPAGTRSDTGLSGPVTVLAAASLTEAFSTLGTRFETAHPGVAVRFSFGSSATLATQIRQGAPADVFAAANQSTMQSVTDAGLAGPSHTFATNTLQIAVPVGNPGRITGLADFADSGRKIAICAPQVPCGAAARQLFRAAGVTAVPDTLEQDVKAALQKVVLNEVDAALVYRTDVVAAAGKVDGIDVPEADRVVNDYPVCILTSSSQTKTATAFVDYVLSAEGRKVLDDAGFGPPPGG